MKKLSFSEFTEALRRSGLERGDTVHVQSDLRRMGMVDVAASRTAILEFYLRAFREVLGESGTLTVFTGTMSLGRSGASFVREETPSEVGVFSEFIRTQPGAVRSVHPVMSVAGIGPRAEEICGGAHFEGLGWDSPWGRLHRANAWIVSLGIAPDQAGGTTFFHYPERIYGVPYQYTKLLSIPVIAGGKPIPGPFTLSVRYLDYGIVNKTQAFKSRLLEKQIARISASGSSFIFCGGAQQIFDEAIAALSEDRWFLLARPPAFRPGEIPFDGATAARQTGIADR